MKKSFLVAVLFIASFVVVFSVLSAISPELLNDEVFTVSVFFTLGSTLFLIFRKKINEEVEKHNSKQIYNLAMFQKVPKVQLIMLLTVGSIIIVYKLIFKYFL